MKKQIVVAIPKGRIMKELHPLLEEGGISPKNEHFFDEDCRELSNIDVTGKFCYVKVRGGDIPVFVSKGAAQIGIVGSDIFMESNYQNIYCPMDLNIGKCRISLASMQHDMSYEKLVMRNHLRIATKYPNITSQFFAHSKLNIDYIKLNGSMELAPIMQLSDCIVDLVSTGNTLRTNGLTEFHKLHDIYTVLIVNKVSYNLYHERVDTLINIFDRVK